MITRRRKAFGVFSLLLVGCTTIAGFAGLRSGEVAKAQTPPAPNSSDAAAGKATIGKVNVDDSQTEAKYANFVRVTGTPEEIVLDFGLNSQPVGVGDRPVKISQREVMNFYTAKRMLNALQLTIQRHEDAFGPIEPDVEKRFRDAQKK
jgi:hypothetical protein